MNLAIQQRTDQTPLAPIFPDLRGKVAVVTGGSGVIGSRMARELGRSGVKVCVNGREQGALDEVADGIRAEGGVAIAVAADNRDFAAVEELRARVQRELGPVDILLPFAGGTAPAPALAHETWIDDWHSAVTSNLDPTFMVVKSFVPAMVKRRSGSIVLMGSSIARQPSRGVIAYATAKAGVISFARQLAAELGPYGIRVNCVCPGAIERERQRGAHDEPRSIASAHPLGRLGRPEDVAYAVLFLASASASFISGVTLDVAGGRISV